MNVKSDEIVANGEKEYTTRDQGFAAYLATRFMFLDAIDSGESSQAGYPIKEFLFIVPEAEDMDKHWSQYKRGADDTMVPAKVMFNKLRLMRQACNKSFTGTRS